jgi:FkbM family methyltransferase
MENIVLEEITNCFLEPHKIKWGSFSDNFMINNQPMYFQHDFNVKKHIISNALNFQKNICIIDTGAHIGDGSLPIAQALSLQGREDIIVYAIDPTKEKCEYMEYVAKINNIKNIRVLNFGLSDQEEFYDKNSFQVINDGNTGATQWVNSKRGIIFQTLDGLVEKEIIKEKIGYIHLDVEGMESKVTKGGIKSINKDLPIISFEQNYVDGFGNKPPPTETDISKLLPKSYKNIAIIDHNYIFVSINL